MVMVKNKVKKEEQEKIEELAENKQERRGGMLIKEEKIYKSKSKLEKKLIKANLKGDERKVEKLKTKASELVDKHFILDKVGAGIETSISTDENGVYSIDVKEKQLAVLTSEEFATLLNGKSLNYDLSENE